MSDLMGQIKACVQSAVAEAYPQIEDCTPYLIVTHATNEAFGDYQCNSAMPLAKVLKQPPRQIAETLQAHLAQEVTLFAKVDVAGPGFINVHISDAYLLDKIHNMHDSDDLAVEKCQMSEKVIIDYSSPNVAKEMHVGHLRSTIIGDCLARVYRYLGYDLLALSHLGDWGTAFGMLIAYLERHEPGVLAGNQEPDVSDLVAWYKSAKQLFDDDEAFKRDAQLAVVALQQGDAAKRRAWERLCAISRRAYQAIYDLLDVHLVERGESFYQPYLAGVVADLDKAGLLTTHDGAQCVFLAHFKNREGEPLPLIVQKSDGGYNYATTDLAAIKHRVQTEKAGQILYVVDAGQSTHLNMVFETAAKVGYVDLDQVRVAHVPFGLVLGEDGKKFKTRAGHTEKLMDLLTEAVARAKAVLQQRDLDMNEHDLHQTASIMGLGAVKYADLSVNKTSDYQFSYDKMLRFDGNTAVFVMYAYVRMRSIERALPNQVAEVSAPGVKACMTIDHPTERALALHLVRFEACLQKVIADCAPNRLTDYAHRLAELCHAFHRDCRVAGSALQASRLQWCALSRRVLCASLDLLGIRVPERM